MYIVLLIGGLKRVLQNRTNYFAKRKAVTLTWNISLQSHYTVNSHIGSLLRSPYRQVQSDYRATWCTEWRLLACYSKGKKKIKELGLCRNAVSDLLSVTVRTLNTSSMPQHILKNTDICLWKIQWDQEPPSMFPVVIWEEVNS